MADLHNSIVAAVYYVAYYTAAAGCSHTNNHSWQLEEISISWEKAKLLSSPAAERRRRRGERRHCVYLRLMFLYICCVQGKKSCIVSIVLFILPQNFRGLFLYFSSSIRRLMSCDAVAKKEARNGTISPDHPQNVGMVTPTKNHPQRSWGWWSDFFARQITFDHPPKGGGQM